MISRFLPHQEDSIVNYYVLPLAGLSKKDFGSNFVSAKINKKGTVVYIRVKEDIYPDRIYRNKIIHGDITYLQYNIHKEFIADMKWIMKGRYSSMSDAAKNIIKARSGLMYNKVIEGEAYTSKMIFALDKDPALIDFMFDALKCPNPKYNWGDDEELLGLLHNIDLTETLTHSDFIENIND